MHMYKKQVCFMYTKDFEICKTIYNPEPVQNMELIMHNLIYITILPSMWYNHAFWSKLFKNKITKIAVNQNTFAKIEKVFREELFSIPADKITFIVLNLCSFAYKINMYFRMFRNFYLKLILFAMSLLLLFVYTIVWD